MADADDITVKIEVKASELVEACIKALVEGGTLVEVVRCKDCKFYEFWERRGIYLCERWAGDPYEAAEPGDDDFCSFAERREVKNGTD